MKGQIWTYVLQETRTTNYMVLFLSYFLDFSDQYNDGNNSAGHTLGPCSWWQNITNNAFTVQILFVICFLIRYSCIK